MKTTIGLFALFVLLLAAGCARNAAVLDRVKKVTWEPVGIGGGGGIYNPSVSPHDSKLVLVGCDMGGWYRSADDANHWRMCDGHQVRKVNFPAVFHPNDANVIYVGTRGGIKRSRDRGLTWEHVAGKFTPADPDMTRALAIDPKKTDFMLAGFTTWMGEKGEFLVQSVDGGKTWTTNAAWTDRDKSVKQIFFDPASPAEARTVIVGTNAGPYRSDDRAKSWKPCRNGLPEGSVFDYAAAWDPMTGRHAIYATVKGQWVDEAYSGGVYKSADLGENWTEVNAGLDLDRIDGKIPQYQFLAMSPKNPDVVYVSVAGTKSDDPQRCSSAYRTADGGKSWTRVLFGVPAWKECNVKPDWMTLEMTWWWGGRAIGLGCNPNDPDEVFFTDYGRGIQSTDGGRTWFPFSTRRVADDVWDGRGLEVTTSYEYYFDPFDAKRTYIAYTDFGFTRSLDRGKTWIYGARGVPWSNTCYELALDPERLGVAFGCWANAHDLIHWKMIHDGIDKDWWKGGVTKTADHCATWEVMGKDALPEKPATTIKLDLNSPKDSRTLYVGILGKGVYKSTDDGKTWAARNKGLDIIPGNLNVWRLDLHPDGTLLCGVSVNYGPNETPIAGALFRSADGAETWEKVNVSRPMPYIWGVRMDPRDSKIIYVSCFDVPPGEGYRAMGTGVPWPKSQGGGLFKSTDGGKTWTTILAEPYCWDVTFDPVDPDIVYAGTFVGQVFRSTDAGKTWQWLEGLPFIAPHRAKVDPTNRNVIYVTTFGGGVWKGTME